MSDLRARVASTRESLWVLTAGLAATVVVLLGSLTGAGPGQLLVTAAAVGLVTAVLATTGRQVLRPVPVRASTSGVPGAVPASTAYWCALEVPSCPQRPRAPGRH
ncbi:hypothetical protein [Terrabacter sp. NPDC080008]|uniref:hypothetical protein n=1 Tax=Terrabacter sp. NPDC080008 TaxID=3155176 RepID=UPI00344EC965